MEYNINVNLVDETIEVFFPKEYNEKFKNSIDIIEDLIGRFGKNEYEFFRLFYYAECYERDFNFEKLKTIFYSPANKEKPFSKICFVKENNDYLTINYLRVDADDEEDSNITFARIKPNEETLYYYYERGKKIIIE